MKAQEIKIGKLYVGDRLLEDLSAEEREAFSRRCAERMGRAFSDWYRQHPEELGQLRGIPERDRGTRDADCRGPAALAMTPGTKDPGSGENDQRKEERQ